MYGIGWFIGANYYQVKNWLKNRGFEPTDDHGPIVPHEKCYCKYSNGSESITLYYYIKPGKTQGWICDEIYDYTTEIYDSVRRNGNSLCESILDGIRKALLESLN